MLSNCSSQLVLQRLSLRWGIVQHLWGLWQIRNILIDSWSADGKVLAHNIYVNPFQPQPRPKGYPDRMDDESGIRLWWWVKNNELCESLRFPLWLARSTPFAHRKGGKAAHNRWFRGWSTDRRKPPQAKQAAVELDLFTAIRDEEIRACDCG